MPTSQLEEWTREYFETKFKPHKFPNVRPDWMKNKNSKFNLELDGYNERLKLAFEAQGQQHYKRVPRFQPNPEDFERQVEHDLQKQLRCAKFKVRLIIVPPLKTREDVWNFLILQFSDPLDATLEDLSDDFVHMRVDEVPPRKSRSQPTRKLKSTTDPIPMEVEDISIPKRRRAKSNPERGVVIRRGTKQNTQSSGSICTIM